VLADLSGQPKEALKPMKEREFTPIDRDNIDQVLEKAAPRVAVKVQDRITGKDQKLAVELNFRCLEDFEPARVAEQVGPLRELLEMRQALTNLLGKMEGNDKLEQQLSEVLSSQDKAIALAKEMGIEAGATDAPKPEGNS